MSKIIAFTKIDNFSGEYRKKCNLRRRTTIDKLSFSYKKHILHQSLIFIEEQFSALFWLNQLTVKFIV